MIRIMSSNIWGDYFHNPVEIREEQLEKVINTCNPDILGMQEATAAWNRSDMFRRFEEEYEFVRTEEAPTNNFVPLLYRRKQFTLLRSGFLRFPDTPDPSKGATWAILEEKGSRGALLVFSTHFWWQKFGVEEHENIRVSNARKVNELAELLMGQFEVPAVAVGDFNSQTVGQPVVPFFCRNGWKEAQSDAEVKSDLCTHHGDPVLGEDGLYHGKRPTRDYQYSIDHIFYRGGMKAVKFEVVTDQDALDATDHSPIYADFEFVK